MLFHRYRLSSFRTENRKQKGHLPPSFFCDPHDEEFYTHATIIYHLTSKYNGHNNKSAYAMHKRF